MEGPPSPLCAAVLLHGAIIVIMGLFGFGLVMIALVLASCIGGTGAGTIGQLIRNRAGDSLSNAQSHAVIQVRPAKPWRSHDAGHSAVDPSSASETELDDYFAMRTAVAAVDMPEDVPMTREAYVGRLLSPEPHLGDCLFWAAFEDEQLIGLLWLGLPRDENDGVIITDV